jgi:hypothetical protein
LGVIFFFNSLLERGLILRGEGDYFLINMFKIFLLEEKRGVIIERERERIRVYFKENTV